MKCAFGYFLLFSLYACTTSQKSQYSKFDAVKAAHKTIAILPAFVKLLVPDNQQKSITKNEIEDAQVKLSFIIQNEMYKWFQKNKYSVTVQDVRYSNRTLFEKGLSYEQYKTMPTDTLAKILGVDAVVVCMTDLTKISYESVNLYLNLSNPISAIASVGLSGMSLANPQVNVIDDIDLFFRIVDANTNGILWEKSYKTKNQTNAVLEKFYRNAIKNLAKIFPYRK